MASDYVTELAAAVDSIGGKGRTGEPYVTPMRPKPAAENLATLEAWLRKQLSGCCEYRCYYMGHGTQGNYWFAMWTRTPEAAQGYRHLGEHQADTEQEARALAAIEAVAAILKEKAKES